ncbi:uncharacterized protein LOC124938180 [Impatiens glandulifera]|uniref:uncharacterized protein LOC124938180 n=1 Tax=Impatiens glandulifera TaxID=253017 RepID=UPI001FB113AC|nr:uncharacterized protein LOC124938180 [Impatiens glandulifera]
MDEEMSESSASLEESNQVSSPGNERKEGRMRRELDDSDDDGTQVVKQQRMKGLKDLGIGDSSLSKRKRSQTAHVHEFLKRKNRCRPLTKVLKSKTKVVISEQPIANRSCGSPLPEPIENGTSQDKHTEGLVPILVSPKPQDIADGQSSQSIQDITKSSGNKESVESDSTSSAVVDINDISRRFVEGISRWKSKGKRNSRHMSKHKVTAGSAIQMDSLLGWNWPDLLPSERWLPYRQSCYTMNPIYHIPIRGYDPSSSLFDVHLKVKASYRPPHVPYISLMSKLNGRAIIGHPITAEVLDESVCDRLVGGASESKHHMLKDDMHNNIADLKDSPAGLKAKTNQGSGKNLKQSKSPNTRKNGLSSKKIRKLSSLTGSQKQSHNEKNLLVEKVKGPVIACVPLKVVFSRINASFNSSMRFMAASSSSNP